MHAALATLEWLVKDSNMRWTNIWAIFKEPNKTNNNGKLIHAEKLNSIHTKVSELLMSPSKAQQLSLHLKNTLGLNDDQIKAVMWAPPRSIMMSFLPELNQNLQFNWGARGHDWEGIGEKNPGPMPKFQVQIHNHLDTSLMKITYDQI